MRGGCLVVLESTTYPGTTEELVLPALRECGLEVDRSLLLAFSPERVDPGNAGFPLRTIPKVVGGVSRISTEVAAALDGTVFDQRARGLECHLSPRPASSSRTAFRT